MKLRAREKGYAVPGPMLERALEYVRDVQRHIPREYGPGARLALRQCGV